MIFERSFTLFNKMHSTEIRKSLKHEPLFSKSKGLSLEYMVCPYKQNASSSASARAFEVEGPNLKVGG